MRVCAEDNPDLIDHFRVATVPTIMIVEGRRVRAHLENPRHCKLVEDALSPWLR